nr:CotD family spore coat protein [Heyndrickxia shackletonii]
MPSYTTHVNHQVIHHYNYYPHNDSFINEVDNVGPAFGSEFGPGFGAGPYGFPKKYEK